MGRERASTRGGRVGLTGDGRAGSDGGGKEGIQEGKAGRQWR